MARKSAKKPIRLGLLTPLTGIVSLYGQEIRHAAEIACQQVNDAGGVLGRPLELVVADDGSLPESAVPAARKLITEDGCAAIIGNLLSNARIAVAHQVADPLKTPMLNFSFYEGSIFSPYFFHFAALPNQQIEQMIPYMAERFGPKMYFAGSDYEWPRGSIDAAKTALLKSGGEIVGEEYQPLGELNPKGLLSRLAKSGADVFVPYFAGAEQASLLTAFTKRGLKTKMAVVMGHYDEAMVSGLPPDVRAGLFSSNTYFMTVKTPENRRYLKTLAFHPDIDGIWPSGNGVLTNFGEGTYLCVKAFAAALDAAGSQKLDDVLKALRHVSVKGPQGRVTMDPMRQHARVNCYLAECDASGAFQIVKKFGGIDPAIPGRYLEQFAHALRDQASHESAQSGPRGDGGANNTRPKTAFDLNSDAHGVLDIADIGIVSVDVDGIILQANEGACEMFGYEKPELIGESIGILLPPRFRARHQALIRDFTASSLTRVPMRNRPEIAGYRKDGSEFPAEATLIASELNGKRIMTATIRDVTLRRQSEAELLFRATHDELTDLPNRTLLQERLSNSLRRAERSGVIVGILFIDLDNFKLINDSYGHDVGDQLLKAVGQRLLASVRAGDIVARFGGDEFVVLCDQVSNEAVLASLADRVNRILRNPVEIGELPLYATASIGLALTTAGALSAAELLRNADAAMYRAKDRGRDKWSVFDEDTHEHSRKQLAIANGLRKAIERAEFEVALQPIVNSESTAIQGAEVLLRWQTNGKNVSPADFIPVAEMTGTIKSIGAWVFAEACTASRLIRDLPDAPPGFYLSVNVSGRQLEEPGFLDQIRDTVAKTGADPRSILIEITESTLMSEIDSVVNTLGALGDMGFRLAIDDFGTGYSSLGQLTRLPLSCLKVDRLFVSGLTESKSKQTVTKAVIGLAHSLGLSVVAEGVETEAQLAQLRALGCNNCQGYLFHQPMPLERLIETLGTQRSSLLCTA